MTAEDKTKHKGRNALKFLVAGDAAVTAVKNAVEPPVQGAKETASLLKRFFSQKEDQTYIVQSESNDPFVRFSDSVKEGNVSEKELAWRVKFSARVFNAILLCIGIIVAGVIIHPPSFEGSVMVGLMYLTIAFSGFCVLLSVLVRWGFFNYQLRNRALFKVGQYLKSPGEWFPSSKMQSAPSSGSSGKNIRAAMMLIVGLAGLSMTTPASAATSSDSSCSTGGGYVLDTFSLPCKDDLFRNALEVIFPDVGPLTAQTITIGYRGYAENTNGQSAVAEAFMAFICVLFFVGASTLIWHTVMLIVNMSQEGAAIHQRWSGVWTTSRLFFGASLLAPYVKGYCLANVLVLYAALWSGSLGNIIYNAYLSGLEKPVISGSAVLPGITPTLQHLAIKDVCYNITKLQNQRAIEAGAAPANAGVPSSVTSPTSTGVGYGDSRSQSYQQTLNDLLKPDRLGGTNAARSSSSGVSTEVYTTWDFGPACGRVSLMTPDPNASSAFGTYGKAETEAFKSFVKTMDSSISKVIDKQIGNDTTVPADAMADVQQVAQDYSDATGKLYSSLSDAAYSLLNNANSGNMQSLLDGAKKYGWATSGAFYMNFSRMQGLFDEFLAKTPEADSEYSAAQAADAQRYVDNFINKLKTDGVYSDFYSKVTDTIKNISISTLSDRSAAGDLRKGSSAGSFYNLNINTNSTFLSNPDNTAGYIFTSIGNWIGKEAQKFISSLTGSGTVDMHDSTNKASGSELEKMTEFGQNILSLVYTLIVVIATGSVIGTAMMPSSKLAALALKTPGVGGVISDIIGRLIGFLTWVIGGLFVIGATHAYILPMMPYVQMLMFILSMVTMVMEAMIAAPIWALMHFRLDGQAFVSEHQRAGYMIMFNMFLRIPVAMLGMLLSISVFNATILVMSVTFYPAVESATDGGGGSGFLGSLIMLGMMTYLHYQIAMRSFALVSAVPGQVGRWFGATDGGDPGNGVMQAASAFLAGQATAGGSALMQNAMGAGKNRNAGRGSNNTSASTPGGDTPGGDPTSEVAPSSNTSSSDSGGDAGGSAGSGNTESATPRSGHVAANMGASAVVGNVTRNSAQNGGAIANLGGIAEAKSLANSVLSHSQGHSASQALSSGAMQSGISDYFSNAGISNPTTEQKNAATHLAKATLNEWSALSGDAAITG